MVYSVRTHLYNFKEHYIKRIIDKTGVLLSYHDVRIKNAIILSGSPRSGTTLVMELLGTLPKYKTLFEPFHVELFPEVKQFKLFPKPYLPPSKNHDALETYLSRVFTGQVVSTHPHYRIEYSEIKNRLWFTGVISKFVRANRLLPWISEHFDTRRIFVTFRHPCATISSQVKHRIYGYFGIPDSRLKQVIVSEALSVPEISNNQWLIKKIRGVNSTIGVLAVSWAVDTYIPLMYRGVYGFDIIFYEGLITNPENSLKMIFDSLDETVPTKAYLKIKRPSMLAKDLELQQERQLQKWKPHLTERQIREILDVVSWFGIDFYTEKPEPDYDALLKWKSPFK